MELISGVFFSGVYVFSILSICWWMYLACVHDGAGAYFYLTQQKSSSFLNHSAASVVRKHFELISILVCFIIFLCALCNGFSYLFSWIPERVHLTLGDGTHLRLSTILSCLVGISSSLVFGKWVLIGICSYWEKRALAEQSILYFDIIRDADNIEELNTLKEKTLHTIGQLKDKGAVTPQLLSSRLELCVRAIELRIADIESRTS